MASGHYEQSLYDEFVKVLDRLDTMKKETDQKIAVLNNEISDLKNNSGIFLPYWKTDPPDVFLHQADLFLSYLYMAHVQYHIAGKSYFRLSFLPLLNTSFF